MSSERRPWYPWYPKDFGLDEKVQGLSDDAELLYRRILDVLWQSNELQVPYNCIKLLNQIARGWTRERFDSAWEEIQYPGFELLKISDDGLFVYSKRLKKEAEKITTISNKRKKSIERRWNTNELQMNNKSKESVIQKNYHTDTHTDTDIKENTPFPPKEKKQPKKFEPPTLEMVKSYFAENGFSAERAERAWKYYDVAEWKDSAGKPVKNWKQKMFANWMKPDQKDNIAPQQKSLAERAAEQEARIKEMCS